MKAIAWMVSVCCATTALAAEFTWTGGGTGGWNDPANYEGGSAVPGPGDTVIIPTGTAQDPRTATVLDSDAALVSSLAVVQFNTHGRLIFDITTNTTLNCAVRARTDITSYTPDDVVVKKGACDLRCASYGRNYSGSNSIDYRSSFDVREGSISFPDAPDGESRIDAIIGVSLADGAEWRVGGGTTYNIGSLRGGGSVTNAGAFATIEILAKSGDAFSGTMGGDILLEVAADASLTGTNNTFSQFQTYKVCSARIMKFGRAGEPSSIGTNSYFRSKGDGGRFLYLGEGETTDKALQFTHSYSPVTLDAGATGNLTFAGTIGDPVSTPSFRRFAFDGSNEFACVFSGNFVESDNASTYITKKGPGTWRFTANVRRRNAGVVAVEDGTLQFDTIAEAGTVCSLGTASLLYQDVFTSVSGMTEDLRVPYAYLLGGDTTEGVLEYVGSGDAACASRLIAVKGPARLKNGTDRSFVWKGVCGAGENAKTLTLDGDSDDNTLETVTNACGTLSLVKDGAGTWTLTGEQDVNGTVSVKRGALIVNRPATHPTWYRFSVRQNMNDWLSSQGIGKKTGTNSKMIILQELALYDKDGVRCNKGLEVVDGPTLAACQAMQTQGTSPSTRGLDKLFDDVYAGIGWQGEDNGGTTYMQESLPQSWIVFVMRLADDAPEVTAYDYSNYFGMKTAMGLDESDGNRNKALYSYRLEASMDGETWTIVTNVTGAAESEGPNLWASDNSTPKAGEARPGKGFPVNTHFRNAAEHVFDRVTSVSVASGATLKADVHDGVPVVIRGLTVDPAGAGTIDGFSFAANGTIDVTSYKDIESGRPVTLTFKNATGVENISNWNLTVGGRPDARCSMSFDPATGTFRFFKPGMVILLK